MAERRETRGTLTTRLEKVAMLPDAPGCWIWFGARSGPDYGSIRHNGYCGPAHRYFYEVLRGPIPIGLQVLHSCDLSSCVNPSHLFLGTQLDNMTDMGKKGRRADHRGVKSGTAKLTDDAVAAMRRLHADGASVRLIAGRFDVHEATAGQAISGHSWRHVPMEREN